jgi:hypothetical protein
VLVVRYRVVPQEALSGSHITIAQNSMAGYLAMQYKALGPNLAPATACAAGAHAIGELQERLIRFLRRLLEGMCDRR